MVSLQNLFWIVAQAAPAEAEAAKAAAAAPPAADDVSGALTWIVALAVVIGSFVAGGLIARWLRMKDYGFKIGLVLFAVVASAAICFFGWPPKRGIDLSGGVVLVYEVDTDSSSADWMESAIMRINAQLNKQGGEKLTARPIGDDQIEIDVPEGVDVESVENSIKQLRETTDVVLNLETKESQEGKTRLVYRGDPQQRSRVDMGELIAAVQRRINPGGVKELTIRQYGSHQIEVIIPEVDEREVDQIRQKISKSGLLEFRIVANPTDDRELIRVAQRTAGNNVYIGGRLMGRWVKAGNELRRTLPEAIYREMHDGTTEVLARIDPFNVDGRYLVRAAQGFADGKLAVDFSFNGEGAEKFRRLTSRNLPDEATKFYRHLGIVLDNTMLSAPRLISTIGDNGQITGDFTQDEIEVLVGVLNAGRLPATLRPQPISQATISAQLGDDTIRAGVNAMIISTAAVLIFMFVYYRFAGLVADLAVSLNVLATVAVMILIKAAFTLPGLAGLVLTVGMAVDANVLIYERMREELERGASLRMAIRNGFSRAMATIIDSHVTTLCSGVVLYVVGTDQIKGFAVTLIIGLLLSLFTAVFVARLIFDIVERQGWIKHLSMMRLIRPTNFDFIRWQGAALASSLIVCAIGLAAVVARGKELLDIDFTGGSSVQMAFAEGQAPTIAEVREAVSTLPDVAVSSVGEGGLEYKVDTSDNDISHVKSVLQKTFGDRLETYSMKFGELAAIDVTPPERGAATTPGAAGEGQPAAEGAAQPPAEGEAKPAAGEAKPAEPGSESPPKSEPEPAQEAPKPTEEAQPESTESPPKSSSLRRLTPPPIEVASAGDDASILALLQETPGDKPPAEAASEASPTGEPPKQPESQEPASQPEEKSAPADSAAPAAADAPTKSDEKPAAATDAAASPGETAEADPSALVGGTRAALSFGEEIAHDPLRDLIQQQIDKLGHKEVVFRLTNPSYSPGSVARYNDWTLEISLPPEAARPFLEGVQKQLAATPVFPSSSEIGGKVASGTQLSALYAVLASMLAIVIYIWIRFQNVVFGLAAVLALVHDVAITIAFLAVSYYVSPYLGFLMVDPFKISLAVMAALLTIIGFSINDKIVVFDRIREVRGKSPEFTADMINLSVNQTLSRTLLTGGAVIISCIILYIVGGPGIHGFSFAMLVGVIVGTYSSIYIAAPALLWMHRPSARLAQAGPARGAEQLAGRPAR
jgi:SecD/SecF fusion protein